MNSTAAKFTQEIVPVRLETPPITSPIDADVDVEILRSIPKQFAIEDERTANWLVRKVIVARQYAEHVKAWADQEVRRAEREQNTLLFLFGRQIETWAQVEIAKLHNRKSLALPAGTLGFRTINPCLHVDDESIVLAWAREHLPSAIVTKFSLSRSILKDHFETTGELPDAGAHIEPAAERFYIR